MQLIQWVIHLGVLLYLFYSTGIRSNIDSYSCFSLWTVARPFAVVMSLTPFLRQMRVIHQGKVRRGESWKVIVYFCFIREEKVPHLLINSRQQVPSLPRKTFNQKLKYQPWGKSPESRSPCTLWWSSLVCLWKQTETCITLPKLNCISTTCDMHANNSLVSVLLLLTGVNHFNKLWIVVIDLHIEFGKQQCFCHSTIILLSRFCSIICPTVVQGHNITRKIKDAAVRFLTTTLIPRLKLWCYAKKKYNRMWWFGIFSDMCSIENGSETIYLSHQLHWFL